jgi:hypothetical protein
MMTIPVTKKRPRPKQRLVYVAFAADGHCGRFGASRIQARCPVRPDHRRALARLATAVLAAGGELDCLLLPRYGL